MDLQPADPGKYVNFIIKNQAGKKETILFNNTGTHKGEIVVTGTIKITSAVMIGPVPMSVTVKAKVLLDGLQGKPPCSVLDCRGSNVIINNTPVSLLDLMNQAKQAAPKAASAARSALLWAVLDPKTRKPLVNPETGKFIIFKDLGQIRKKYGDKVMVITPKDGKWGKGRWISVLDAIRQSTAATSAKRESKAPQQKRLGLLNEILFRKLVK